MTFESALFTGHDGQADCIDSELCRGVEDDGGGLIDEGSWGAQGGSVPMVMTSGPVLGTRTSMAMAPARGGVRRLNRT